MPVYDARKRIGAELAREADVPADVIVPVPDSGVPAAMGYSKQSGIPFELGIIRNHYVGRTFIEPTDHIRHLGVKLKHSANRPVLEGKRVVLVDDSIVRGTTSKKIVEMVRAAGAKEVHMRISSPPTTHSCFYGIDTPERSKLLAASHNVRGNGAADRRRQPGVHLHRRAVSGAGQATGATPTKPYYCDACFTGDYPIPLPDQQDNADRQLSLLAAHTDARPARWRHRAGHRREPRHRRGHRHRTGPSRRPGGDHRPHPGRFGGNRRRDPCDRRRGNDSAAGFA